MTSFGTIVPSSNVMVERVTVAMTRDIPELSAHFARFGFAGPGGPVTSADDYPWDQMLEAGRLLADARMDLLCWNGSRGGELGFARDRELCQRLSDAHGMPAVTSVLGLDLLLRTHGIARIAFVTPFRQVVNDRIVQVWRGEGYDCVAERGAGLNDNFSYSRVDADTLRAMARDVASAGPDAIVFYCTNLPGASLCAELEIELGIPVLDTVSVGVWASLDSLGLAERIDPRWGRLLSATPPAP